MFFLKSSITVNISYIDPNEVKLLSVIGQGSYGTVHVASWRGSLVAAKVISLTPRDIKNSQIYKF